MKRKIDQLKIGAMLSYAQMILQCIISLLYTPIMINYLGDSEFGVYNTAISITSYLSLLNFGFSSAYIRYYSKFKAKKEEKEIARLNSLFMSVFLLFGFIVLIAGTILILNVEVIFGTGFLRQEIKLLKILMIFMVFNMAISFPDSVFTSYVTAQEKFIFQKSLNMIKTVLSPLMLVTVVLFGYKSVVMVLVTTVLTLLSASLNIFYCLTKVRMKFCFSGLNFYLLKEVAIFSAFITINNIIDQINWNVDKMILGRYQGTVAVAIYSTAAQINSLYTQISTSISNIFVPRINRYVVNKDSYAILSLFTKVGRIQFMILLLIGSGYVFFGKYFITNIYAKIAYVDAYYIGLLLMLPAIIPLIQNLGIEIQRAMFKHKFRSIIYLIMAIINVVVSLPLGKLYGGIGCAVGTALSLIIANGIIMNLYYYKAIKLDIVYFWKQILKLLPAFVLPCIYGVIAMALADYKSIFTYGLIIIGYIIIYIFSFWFIGMNDFEKNIVISLLKRH